MKPSIQLSGGEVLRLDISLGWKDPIIAYVKDGVLPNDRAETQKLQYMATRYILPGDVMFKKCNAPIPQIRRRYGDIHTEGGDTLTYVR